MALYSTLRNNPHATEHEIEESFDGMIYVIWSFIYNLYFILLLKVIYADVPDIGQF